MQLLNLTWGAGASVAAGIVLEKIKTESKPIQVMLGFAPFAVPACLAPSWLLRHTVLMRKGWVAMKVGAC